jgi:hypothetical protein
VQVFLLRHFCIDNRSESRESVTSSASRWTRNLGLSQEQPLSRWLSLFSEASFGFKELVLKSHDREDLCLKVYSSRCTCCIIAGRSRSGPLSLDLIAPIFLLSRPSTRPMSSAASLSPDSRPPFMPAHSSSTDIFYRLRNRAPSPRGCCSATTRSSTPSALSAGQHALRYLGAYTHRVAISNSRLDALSEGNVTFPWRDSAPGNKKRLMSLPVDEFLRRFLLHLLPRGFMRIRSFGFLANRRRAEFLPLGFRLLQPSDQPAADAASPALPITRCGNVRFAAEPCSCRTPLRRATSPPISASTQPVRRMNPHLQPPISLYRPASRNR